ncbi:cold-regulated protein 27-like isoform X2 [Salvia hispanica]|uniref:cold-regulated protein 27-like isoform X2 n=1 Tax=Salvia hispanica TaxID=49212 RepID=UPI00200925FC|nr:cold-regulated protein 27-like isoform X2 [Salvia hispanica]
MDSSEFSSRNSVEQEETSKFEREVMAPEWTDEKHCLFLKSMESTFINQLYKSIEMFGLQSHTSSASRSKPLKQKQTCTRTSGQFKVLRDGFWSKVDFQKDESEHDQGEEYKVPLSNPWIQRYRNSKIQTTKRCPSSAKAPLATTHKSNMSPPREDYNEMTDQNFNDEAAAEDNSAKIDEMNTTGSNDQVVPNDNTIRAGNVLEGPQST